MHKIISKTLINALLFLEFPAAGYLYSYTSIKLSVKKDIEKNFVIDPVFNSRVYIHQSGDHNKDSIVLVHGLGDDASKIWSKSIPILEKKFNVITFDLPGFGKSSKKENIYSPEKYSKFLHWIITNYASNNVYLVGHSMGGAICLYYTGTHTKKIKRLVLIDVAGVIHRASYIKKSTDFKRKESNGLFSKFINFSSNFFGKAIENADKKMMPENLDNVIESHYFRDTILNNNPNSIAAIALINTNLAPFIYNINTQTCIIWGGKDKIAPLRTGELLKANIEGSRMFIMPESGHSPMDDDPKKFNKQLMQCLGKWDQGEKEKPGEREKAKLLLITNKKNLSFKGNYCRIEIKNSQNIRLEHTSADSLFIRNSDVTITAGKFKSAKNGTIVIIDSNVTITGSDIKGRVGIISSESNLDLAGVTITGTEAAIRSLYTTSVIFSVCRISSPYNKRYAHESIDLYTDSNF